MAYDVIVIGGGIVGAATAHALTHRGQNVLLLDRFEPGHEHGSSHGDGRVVRFNYPEPIYVEMARLAYAAWEALSTAAGRTLLQKTGLAETGSSDNPQIIAQRANFEQTGVPYEELTGSSYMQRYPQIRIPADSVVLLQADGAAAFATLAVQALWRLVAAQGGETLTGHRVTQIEADDGGVIVHSGGQSWRGRKIVLAAGAWANDLLAPLGITIPLEVTQEQLAYFSPRNEMDHSIGNLNVLLDWHKNPPFYTIPQIEVPGMKLGWHHTGKPVDPEQRRPDDQEILAGMHDYIKERFPHLNPEPIQTVTCLYTSTPDLHFVMDTHPTLRNVVIGAGFSGHGFKFGPTLGEILAALALEETPPVALDEFSLARFENLDQLKRRTGA